MQPAQSLLVLLAFLCSGIGAKTLKTETIVVRERTIVAFVPPEVRTARDDGSINAAAHLSYAVEDTLKCLQPMKLSVKFLYADRIALRNGGNLEVLQVHQMGQAVGAFLIEPGRKAQTIYSVAGPSTLQYLLPRAASKYWLVKACKQ